MVILKAFIITKNQLLPSFSGKQKLTSGFNWIGDILLHALCSVSCFLFYKWCKHTTSSAVKARKTHWGCCWGEFSGASPASQGCCLCSWVMCCFLHPPLLVGMCRAKGSLELGRAKWGTPQMQLGMGFSAPCWPLLLSSPQWHWFGTGGAGQVQCPS